MNVLALDTATERATVAVCRDTQVLAEGHRHVTTHSEGLLGLIDKVLRAAATDVATLDGIACGSGPGSFTGLRIGMATAKGLCLAAQKPLIAVSSLVPLALRAVESGAAGRAVVVILDARRHEVFVAVFRSGALLGQERVCRPRELAGVLADVPGLAAAEPLFVVGDGALSYRDDVLETLGPRITIAEAAEAHVIEARYLAQVAATRLRAGEQDSLSATVPRYIRASDAKLPAMPQDRELP